MLDSTSCQVIRPRVWITLPLTQLSSGLLIQRKVGERNLDQRNKNFKATSATCRTTSSLEAISRCKSDDRDVFSLLIPDPHIARESQKPCGIRAFVVSKCAAMCESGYVQTVSQRTNSEHPTPALAEEFRACLAQGLPEHKANREVSPCLTRAAESSGWMFRFSIEECNDERKTSDRYR